MRNCLFQGQSWGGNRRSTWSCNRSHTSELAATKVLNIKNNELYRMARSIVRIGLTIQYALIRPFLITMIVRMREASSGIEVDEAVDGETAKESYDYVKLALLTRNLAPVA